MKIQTTTHGETDIAVYLYLRTSTDMQDTSPEIQERNCREFCERMGWRVIRTYNDILPGKTPIERRPKFRQLLEDGPREGVRGVIGLGFNRFLRSMKVKIQMERELHDKNMFIWGMDDSLRMGVLPGHQRQRAGEVAMVNFTVSMDQYYSDFISDKIRDHHEFRVSMELHHSGAAPFGYCLGKGAIVINGRPYDGWVPDTADDGSGQGMTFAQRYDWIVERFLVTENMMAIAKELTALKVPPPRLVQWNRLSEAEQADRLETQARNREAGHRTRELPPSPHWDSSVLSDMLRSEAYLGRIAYTPSNRKAQLGRGMKEWRPGRHQPLNTPERHAKVQAVLAVRGRSNRHPAQKRLDVLLNQMLLCTCGHAMTYSQKNKHQYKYRCNYNKKSGGVACATSGLNGRAVEQVAFNLLVRGVRVRLEEVRAAIPLVLDAPNSTAVEQEIASLQAKRDRVLTAYVDGDLGEGATGKARKDSMLAPILVRLRDLEQQLVPVEQPQADELEQALTNITAMWKDFPNWIRRDILRAYVPEGFRLVKTRTLQAEVCGVLLEADIPSGDNGPKPRGGMRLLTDEEADAMCIPNENDPPGKTEWAVSSDVPLPVKGGNYRSGGI